MNPRSLQRINRQFCLIAVVAMVAFFCAASAVYAQKQIPVANATPTVSPCYFSPGHCVFDGKCVYNGQDTGHSAATCEVYCKNGGFVCINSSNNIEITPEASVSKSTEAPLCSSAAKNKQSKPDACSTAGGL